MIFSLVYYTLGLVDLRAQIVENKQLMEAVIEKLDLQEERMERMVENSEVEIKAVINQVIEKM